MVACATSLTTGRYHITPQPGRGCGLLRGVHLAPRQTAKRSAEAQCEVPIAAGTKYHTREAAGLSPTVLEVGRLEWVSRSQSQGDTGRAPPAGSGGDSGPCLSSFCRLLPARRVGPPSPTQIISAFASVIIPPSLTHTRTLLLPPTSKGPVTTLDPVGQSSVISPPQDP